MKKFKKILTKKNHNNEIMYKYGIEEMKETKFIYLIKSPIYGDMENQKPLFMGIITKENKRGITFKTVILNDKNNDIFLSRGEFKIETI